MKKKITLVALLLCFALCVGMFTACKTDQVDKTLIVLDAPTNVRLNAGSDIYSSEDDTVSFDAVEHAESYQVFVYKEGDEKAKVTSGTETTIELAYPLDAGDYKIAVIAVGDNVTYGNSNGSEPIDYTIEERSVITLGKVSNIAIDFSKIDEDNSVYPTISFTGVENASRYLVDIFEADSNYEKQLTSLGYKTRLTVPADKASGCMLDSTNYNDLAPGYFVVEVTAIGDDEYILSGDIATANVAWTGVTVTQPVIEVKNVDNGGISVELTNYDSYKVGTSLTVDFYSDEACTTLVTSKTLTYTTSESFGNVTHNKTLAVEVVKADAEGDIKVGTTYYVKASFDKAIYTGDTESDVVSITPAKEGKGTTGGGGGFPGGGGGGGGGGASMSYVSSSFTAEASTVTISYMNNTGNLTATKSETAGEGSTYSYTLSGAGAMGEAITGTVEFKTDGTAVITVNGFGPFAAITVNGTWTESEGTIVFTKAA